MQNDPSYLSAYPLTNPSNVAIFPISPQTHASGRGPKNASNSLIINPALLWKRSANKLLDGAVAVLGPDFWDLAGLLVDEASLERVERRQLGLDRLEDLLLRVHHVYRLFVCLAQKARQQRKSSELAEWVGREDRDERLARERGKGQRQEKAVKRENGLTFVLWALKVDPVSGLGSFGRSDELEARVLAVLGGGA
jgi:hypothetical protein